MEAATLSTETESKLHFLDYWRIIRIRKFLILAVFLLVVATTAVVTYWLPQTYASMVGMAVQKDVTDVDVIGNQSNLAGYDPYWIQTQFETLQSMSVLTNVITELHLSEIWGKRLGEEGPLKDSRTLDLLQHRMQVRQIHNSSIIEIKVFSEEPNEAALIANKIAEVYRNNRLEERARMMKSGIDKYQEEFNAQDQKVAQKQAEVDKLRKDLQINDITSEMSALNSLSTETLRRTEAARIEARTRYDEPHSLLESLKKLSPTVLGGALLTAQFDDPLSQLIKARDDFEQQLAIRQKEYGNEHVEVKKLEEALKTTNRQIEGRVNSIMTGLQGKVDATKAELDELTREVEAEKQKERETIELNNPYTIAKRDLENLQMVRQMYKMKIIQETTAAKIGTSASVTVINPAQPVLKPVSPKIPLNLALGVIVGVIVGVGLAFFIEYLDTSVKTIDDVERAMQAPVIGVIPQNVRSLIEEGEDSPHAEAYRVLRTNVLFNRKDKTHNTITVVSAGAGEGKSTTTFNLAVIFAQNGQRVLLVDSDLRRPSLHKVLKVSNSIGLTSYLLGLKTMAEVIQTTPVTGLDFLPSGKLPASSIGILNSQQMRDFIKDIKSRYDWVFFDSPPILGVSDASILVSEVDLTLLVIQYRKYPQAMSIRAKQTAEKVGGNLIGMVLNNINISQDSSYYYYSGYHYSSYTKEEEEESNRTGTGADGGGKTSLKQKY